MEDKPKPMAEQEVADMDEENKGDEVDVTEGECGGCDQPFNTQDEDSQFLLLLFDGSLHALFQLQRAISNLKPLFESPLRTPQKVHLCWSHQPEQRAGVFAFAAST